MPSTKGKVLGALAAGGVAPLLLPGVAAATPHQVQTLANGGHVLIFRADETEVGGGLEHWSNFRTSETAPVGDTVCNYQSYLAEQHPRYGWIFDQYSSRHRSCSFMLAFFDWPNWEANYVEDTRFRGKWRSDNTVGGNWQTIGDLKD